MSSIHCFPRRPCAFVWEKTLHQAFNGDLIACLALEGLEEQLFWTETNSNLSAQITGLFYDYGWSLLLKLINTTEVETHTIVLVASHTARREDW